MSKTLVLVGVFFGYDAGEEGYVTVPLTGNMDPVEGVVDVHDGGGTHEGAAGQ